MKRAMPSTLAIVVALAAVPAGAPVVQPGPGQLDPVPPFVGMYLGQAQINALGPIPLDLAACATKATYATPDVKDQDNQGDADAFCGALYYAKTGNATIRTKVRQQLSAAIDTDLGAATSLSVSRNVSGYVIAADLINLPDLAPVASAAFDDWLEALKTRTYTDGRSIRSTHDDRPNNWGTHAGASRIAIDIYTDDTADLDDAAKVFHGYLGDRSLYAGFTYGSLEWQADENAPVGINPLDAEKTISGASRDIDGVVPDDQRRSVECVPPTPPDTCPSKCPECHADCSVSLRWPPCKTGYVWEALQGVALQALLLSRQVDPQELPYDAWNWNDQAVRRAAAWLHDTTFRDGTSFPAAGDDQPTPWLINFAYDTTFPVSTATQASKNGIDFTDYTHGNATTSNATADTYVDDGNASNNFGTANPLFLDGSPVRRIYLKFAQVTGATTVTLRFYNVAGASGSGYDVRTIAAADEGWGETTLTWANQPSVSSPVASASSMAAGWNEIDIPLGALQASGTTTLVITRSSSSRMDVTSREGANKPALIVTH
jgi:hypothetical protein